MWKSHLIRTNICVNLKESLKESAMCGLNIFKRCDAENMVPREGGICVGVGMRRRGATRHRFQLLLSRRRVRTLFPRRPKIMALTQHLRFQHVGIFSNLLKETQRRGSFVLSKAHQSTSADGDHPRILITGKPLRPYQILFALIYWFDAVFSAECGDDSGSASNNNGANWE